MTLQRSRIRLRHSIVHLVVATLMVQTQCAFAHSEGGLREREIESSNSSSVKWKACKLIQHQHKLRISDECEPIDYVYLECAGYCESNTFFYKEEEISSVACCSLQHVQFRQVKLHCARRLDSPDQFGNDHVLYRKDSELMQAFQNSFQSSQWTDLETASHGKSTAKILNANTYTGYYTIIMATNASCHCSKMTQN